jgi:hypothetical protein
MKLPGRRTHADGVAIGKNRIAVLTHDAVVVRSLTKFEEITRVPMHDPRSLEVMADGSFLSADAVHTAWLLPGDIKSKSFPRVVLLPESALFADRGTPDCLWVLSGRATTLFGYVLSTTTLGLLQPNEWVVLDGYDGRVFGSLLDGSFLYSTPTGFRQFYGPAKKNDIAGELHEAFRLLPASRVDTIWLVSKDGAVLFRLLAGKLVRLRTVTFSLLAYDVDSDGPYLAVLELSQPNDAPWAMALEVFDVDGKRHLHQPLSAEESLDQNTWLDVLTRNRRIAIAAGVTPLVAVGGPDTLMVFRADKGDRLLPPP